jgi:hypothetical protein
MVEEAGTTLTKEQMAEYLALKAAQEQQAQGPPQVTLASAQTPRAAPMAALPMAPAPYPGGGEAHYDSGDQQVAGPYHPTKGHFKGSPPRSPSKGIPLDKMPMEGFKDLRAQGIMTPTPSFTRPLILVGKAGSMECWVITPRWPGLSPLGEGLGPNTDHLVCSNPAAPPLTEAASKGRTPLPPRL